MQTLKKLKWNLILLALGLIVLGVVIIIWPTQVKAAICYIIAALLIAIGIVSLISYMKKDAKSAAYRYDLVVGLTAILAGVLVILKVDEIAKLVYAILGFLVTISGIIKLQNAVDMLRLKYKNWLISFVMAVVSIIAGIVLLINPFSAYILGLLIGIFLIYCGLTDIYVVVVMSTVLDKTVKKIEDIEEKDSSEETEESSESDED